MSHADRKIVAFGLGLLACGAGLVLATGALLGHAAARTEPPAAATDRCAAPAWVGALPVSTAAADRLARWAMLCADVEHGRIDRATYAVQWRELMAPPRAIATSPTSPAPAVQWAARVVDFSSQWGDPDWSAQQVLGPPDVQDQQSDPRAWAAENPDTAREHITVELATPVPISAIDVYETMNPGVVSIELFDASGAAIGTAHAGLPADERGLRHRYPVDCTEHAVARIKLTVDSSATPGWTELDAVGVVPCGD